MIRALMLLLLVSGLAAPVANAEDFTVCPSGRTGVATEDTSCAFADSVRAARSAQPGSVVTAFSPVTQQSYVMQCAPTVTSFWSSSERCVGTNSYGVSLIVFIDTSAASGPGSSGQSSNSGQLSGSAPSVGVDADSPYVPNMDAPNIGCTWVSGYTRKDGTSVSGYMRC